MLPLWAQKLPLPGPQPGVDASPVHVLQLGACSQAWGWPGMGWLMLVIREEGRWQQKSLSEDSHVPFNQRGLFEIRTTSFIFGSISPDGQRPKLLSSRCPPQTSPKEEP